MKLLTIAIPAYNMEKYLPRCLDSLVASAHLDDLDILVIDDGSTDKTAVIADTYMDLHWGKVRCIHKANGHYGSALNMAMANARGVYFRVVDSDDCVDTAQFDACVETLKNLSAPIDLLVNDYVLVRETGDELVAGSERLKAGVASNLDAVELETQLLPAVTYRTQILRDSHTVLDEGTAFTDEEYLLYPMPLVRRVLYCPAAAYRYEIGREGQSISYEDLDKNIEQNGFVTSQVLTWYENLDKTGIPEANLAYIRQKVADVVLTHMRKRMVAKQSNEYKRAVKRLDSRVRKLPEINGLIHLRSLKLCRMTGYLAWRGICRQMKKRGNVLVG